MEEKNCPKNKKTLSKSNSFKLSNQLAFNNSKESSSFIHSIPSFTTNLGQPKSAIEEFEQMNDYDILSEGECDLSDIEELETVSDPTNLISLQLEIGAETYKLHENRLLAYGEAAQIFYSLYNKNEKLKSIKNDWTKDEITLLNWLLIQYSSQHKTKIPFFV